MTGDAAGLRFDVHVRTGVARIAVGGRYGESALSVAVTARPVEGAANRAVVVAVAAAFGVARGDVDVVAGQRGRNKVVYVRGCTDELKARLGQLLGPG